MSAIKHDQLISVIVPVYNAAEYLVRCVDSILQQTYPKIELILIDDGSIDSSWKICQRYCDKDQRVIIHKQPNSGSSIARNSGLDLAQGDFIGFVDSDDWIDKDMFGSMLSYAQDHELDVVECGYIRSSDLKEEKPTTNTKNNLVETKEEAMERLLRKQGYSVWRRIYRQEILEGLRFIPGKIHQDVFFTIDVINRIDKQGYIPAPLYKYNNENESVIRSPYNKKKLNAKDSLYYIVNNTKVYNHTIRFLAKKYLLDGLVTHYNSLFLHSYLDKNFNHRKTIRKEISKELSFKDRTYSFFGFLAKFSPFWFYNLILKFNKLRIKVQLIILKI
ncbi:glycosyltransferase [uncultured Zobellia sp.]|uniref:glycosyltransferase family 2 protein n=1 Tax=uncultured Zobellia sp. TaxID=255433 RepID=UPI0025952B70|nr:glycosyltransferase [uncultured Zobellia sp.]